jgi:hypothetical protein
MARTRGSHTADMGTMRGAYEWTRDIMAVFGALGCGLALLVVIILFAVARDMPNHDPAAVAPRLPFAEADSLLNEAGIERAKQALELVGENPGDRVEKDRSNIQLYCLHAPGLRVGARWLAPDKLEPMMVLASKTSFDAAHAANACVPNWTDAVWKGMLVQPMQLSWSQRQLGFARLALYDRETQMLYLVSRTTPTSPPADAPVNPAVASAPAPSTE